MIDNNIDACMREYCLASPIHRLPLTKVTSLTYNAAKGRMECSLGKEYLRFARAEFNAWPVPCVKAFDEHGPEFNQLYSKYSKPTVKKPLAVLVKNDADGLAFHFYPFTATSTGSFYYVQNNMGVDKYLDHNYWVAAWLIASRTFAALGDANSEKICFEKYAQKLQLENVV
ncbi:MAG: hypothetical protein A2W93_14360 [Bacteroidetes bacterium GWF2_43_63]|nr:MAG: hypothetical protein A2W94_00930 [Bacteroidetes bacterium GWE2_42_42]OFY52524.1 MAG: hypothetical protein A2W93_14360 [Bacteroidetes bacterium GWF2_43_63]HBG71431.1 hypothetical protein [Bacteroidales bacterium]HCB60817.1 hypothetical protein [Bacteroidales bacterium]HCY23458.1 hypothetical protein [Bacteroidales bacterium]